VLVLLLDELDTEFPLGVCSSLNGVVQISSVEIWVLSSKFQSLVPDKRVCTKMRHPVVLDKGALALGIDQSESVDTETLHVSERSGDGSVRQDPLLHSGGLGVERHEVPGVVMSGLGLRDLDMRLGLDGVDKVDEFDGIWNISIWTNMAFKMIYLE
jgi:hypothetical protein